MIVFNMLEKINIFEWNTHLHVDDKFVFLQDTVPVVSQSKNEAYPRTLHDLDPKTWVNRQKTLGAFPDVKT